MCQQYRIIYPRCGHRETVQAPCEYRDTGVRSIWGKIIPCQKVITIQKDPSRVCSKCSINPASTYPHTDSEISRKSVEKAVPFTQSTQTPPARDRSYRQRCIETSDEIDIARILVRNEAALRRRARIFHIPELPLSFASPSPDEITKQILINEEFLARRAQGRTFRAHELSSETTYEAYFLACQAYLQTRQSLAQFTTTSSISDEKHVFPRPQVLFSQIDLTGRAEESRYREPPVSVSQQDVAESLDVRAPTRRGFRDESALNPESEDGKAFLWLDGATDEDPKEERNPEPTERTITPPPASFVVRPNLQPPVYQPSGSDEDVNDTSEQGLLYQRNSEYWDRDKWSFQTPHGRYLLAQIRKWMAIPESYSAWDIRTYFKRHPFLIDLIRQNLVPRQPYNSKDGIQWLRGSEQNFEGNQMFLSDREMLDWDEVKFIIQNPSETAFRPKSFMDEDSSDDNSEEENSQDTKSEKPESENDMHEQYLVPIISHHYAKLRPHEVSRSTTPCYAKGNLAHPANLRYMHPSPLRSSMTYLGVEIMTKSEFEAHQQLHPEHSPDSVSPLSENDTHDLDDVVLSDEEDEIKGDECDHDVAEPRPKADKGKGRASEITPDLSLLKLNKNGPKLLTISDPEDNPTSGSSPPSSFSQTIPGLPSPLSPTPAPFEASSEFNQHVATIKYYLNLPAATTAYQVSQHLWMHRIMIQSVREGKLNLNHNFQELDEFEAQKKARAELLVAIAVFEAVESEGNWI